MKKTINNHQPIILVEFNKSNFYKIKNFLQDIMRGFIFIKQMNSKLLTKI